MRFWLVWLCHFFLTLRLVFLRARLVMVRVRAGIICHTTLYIYAHTYIHMAFMDHSDHSQPRSDVHPSMSIV